MPGVGSEAPNRNSAMRPSVISIFLRRSGVWNARTKAVSMGSPRFGRSGSPRILPGTSCVVSLGYRQAVPCLVWSGELGDRTAGPLDLLDGRGRERVGGHPQRHAEVAGAEHLDQLTLAGRALGDQVLRGHVAALGEQLSQPAGVHDLLGAAGARAREALQPRHPALQRRLAALE